MIRVKRFEAIQNELAIKGVVDVIELAELLHSSKATIRRDLDALEKLGILKRTHGGAQVVDSDEELPFHTKMMAHSQEKRAIGIKTASCIPDGSIIGCTGGTTVLSIVKHLKEKQITVVTNAINIAMELATSKMVEVIVSGGTLRSRTYEMVGHVADRTLSELNLDFALIGVDGIDILRGISTYTMQEAHAASVFINQAKYVWVVADYSKIGKIAPAIIAPISKVNRIFTDKGIPSPMKKQLEAAGIEVIISD
ncbi:MAG TPA: DeoR/GlpR transcriptional regulator [Rikenellaceae bacterium]|nr:DeoR/GlpR transcriptional regulator [Rikenellaceae bacterium]